MKMLKTDWTPIPSNLESLGLNLLNISSTMRILHLIGLNKQENIVMGAAEKNEINVRNDYDAGFLSCEGCLSWEGSWDSQDEAELWSRNPIKKKARCIKKEDTVEKAIVPLIFCTPSDKSLYTLSIWLTFYTLNTVSYLT